MDEKSKNVTVPDRLSPDPVKKTVEEPGRKRRKWSPAKIAGLAAACVVLIAGVSAAVYLNRGDEKILQPNNAGSQKVDGKIASADDYDQIYSYIENYIEKNNGQKKNDFSYAVPESRSDEIVTENSSADAQGNTAVKTNEADAGAGSHSSTNVRQEGVDEADTVKTDGRYLYVLKDNLEEVSVVEARQGSLEEYGSIRAGEGTIIEEFYLNTENKKLVLVCSTSERDAKGMYPAGSNSTASEAVTYDVSNPAKPVEQGRITQSGSYSSSRMSGDYLYLFSTYYAGMDISRRDKKTYIPLVNNKVLESTDIYLPPTDMGNMYEVVTAVNVQTPDEITDSKAIFSKGGELYVSNENIYYYENEWEDPDRRSTTVRKISYRDGRLKAAAQGSFEGYLNDTFSIDEYEGNLRVAVTVGDTNSVYVMDEQLKIIGSIEGLAEDERIYSARLMGDTGYFVTFRETDPLYSVDLSDPYKPKILGALKIPGFSDYLHFYGENQLLGIGMDVDEKTSVAGGVKLSMFDITDKTDVKESNTHILDNVYSTDVSFDYKAALIDPVKNMIGFPAYESAGQKYYLFSYDQDKGFQCLLSEEINGSGSTAVRGVYIGDVLYIVHGNIIESYSLENYRKIDDIIL